VNKLLAALVVLVLVYVGSPYAAVALVMRAVSRGDEEALASRIDFVALRASLTEQIQTRMSRPGEQPDPLRQTLLPTLVNSYVTPRGFATMLRNRGDLSMGGAAPVDGGASPPAPDFGDLDLGWFFFTRPTRFEVESRMGTLVLEPRSAWWRVVDVRLPASSGMAFPMPTPRIESPSTPMPPPDLEVPDFGTPPAGNP
jgi:hypothetical protein